MSMSLSKLHSCGEVGQMLSQLQEKPLLLKSLNLEVWDLISCQHIWKYTQIHKTFEDLRLWWLTIWYISGIATMSLMSLPQNAFVEIFSWPSVSIKLQPQPKSVKLACTQLDITVVWAVSLLKRSLMSQKPDGVSSQEYRMVRLGHVSRRDKAKSNEWRLCAWKKWPLYWRSAALDPSIYSLL